ncbi:MAG: ATP-binding cassette domain-containing protein [Desulfovibrionaceae bacterium]|nr:ATP-binding cassette domain-containing protein [Desulfovibrionaceae bacterium]MBF0512613.1 ATP-binding cassette domain-containing protein [Desulfovibrionaceae bacterium]
MNPASAKPIIEVAGLTAGYGADIILRDISFTVYQGEVFCILGGSGSGKSTMMKQMIGLDHPRAGKILIDGEDIVAAEGRKRNAILRKFGVTYQSGALFGSMTLKENITLPLEEFTRLPRDAMDLIASMKLKLVGLSGFGDHLPAELSGGMQKRAAIARAMALDPRILFLDEPSAGLDPITSAGLDALILSLAKNMGITFVVVTHELPSINAIADRVIMLDKGRIAAQGAPAELREHSDNPWVRDFFNRVSPRDQLQQTGTP